MIYKVYLSNDHPFRDFLKVLFWIILVFAFVGGGIALAEELFDNEMLVLLIGGLFGGGVLVGLFLLIEWKEEKNSKKKKKKTKTNQKTAVQTQSNTLVDRIAKIDPNRLKAAATDQKIYNSVYKEIYGKIDWSTIRIADLAEGDYSSEDVNARMPRSRILPDMAIECIMDGVPLDIVTRADVAEYLIKHGANVNSEDDFAKTSPLDHACNVEVAKVLIAHGANIEHKTKAGYTPLLSALRTKRYLVAAYLIDCGADVNIRNEEGKTALFYDISPQFTQKLLDHGADKNIIDNNGKKAIDCIQNPNIKKLLK